MSKYKICTEEIDFQEETNEEVVDISLVSSEIEECSDGISTAQESIISLLDIKSIISKTDISLESLKMAELGVSSVTRTFKLNHIQNKISLESLSLEDKKNIVLEGISEALSAIWDRIVATFKYIINKILEVLGFISSKNQKAKSKQVYDKVKSHNNSEFYNQKYSYNVSNHIKFIKTTEQDSVLKVKTLQDLIEHYSLSVKESVDLFDAIDKDMGRASYNIGTAITDNANNDDVITSKDVSAQLFPKILADSEFNKFLDKIKDDSARVIKKELAQSSGKDINQFKILFDREDGVFVVFEKYNYKYEFLKDVYGYKLSTMTSTSYVHYTSLEEINIHDLKVICSHVIDLNTLIEKSIDKIMGLSKDIEKRIMIIDEVVKSKDNADALVREFIIGFITNYKTAVSMLTSNLVDLGNKSNGILRLVDVIENIFSKKIKSENQNK